MPTKIITTDDLWEFKMELLEDIKKLLVNQSKGKLKKHLKSSEIARNHGFTSNKPRDTSNPSS